MPDAKPRTVTKKNGSSRASLTPFAAGSGVAAYDDPMSKVLGLDEDTDTVTAWLVYTVGAVALFLAITVGARVLAVMLARMDASAQAPAAAPQEIEVEEPPPPPPPPAPEETAAAPEPAPPVVKAPPKEAPPPMAAPAQAARVLAQEPDPNEPVDLTGNTIVQGNADTYAGGTTAANGTSNRAVRNIVTSPTGVPGGTGTVAAPPPSGPDRSRRGAPAQTDWNAPFPAESDVAQINEAYVLLQIDIKPDGTPAAVRIAKDPGNGFGREARRYALSQTYKPALDHDGNPIASTITTTVHFER
jgi:outer membrane biosynthesis protein TonB